MARAVVGKLTTDFVANTAPFARGIRGATSKLGGFVKATVAASAAAAAALVIPVRAAARFEHQMARVRALTGATETDFDALTNQARSLGATTEHTASQAAEAMSAFALAGFDASQIYSAMPATLSLASAGQVSVGESADIAAKLMAGMGLQASELDNAVDVMAKAFTSSNQTITMLGDAMSYVGPVARTAGYELEEVTAAIMAVSNAGIQGQQAGAGLRRIMLALASPSAEASKTMASLGISVADAQGEMRSMPDLIDDFNRAIGGLGSAAQLDILGTIFGARGATVAAALINTGSEAVRGFEESLAGAGGTAASLAATQLDTLQGSWIKLKSAAESLAISVGDTFGPLLRKAVDGATAMVQNLQRGWQVAMATIEFVTENWRDVLLLAYKQVQLGLVSIPGVVKHFFLGVLPPLFGWFADNWKNIFLDAYNLATTVFTNLGSNIVSVFSNIPKLISGEADFSELWTPVLEGFESTLSALPNIPPRQMGLLEKALTRDIEELSGSVHKSYQEHMAEALTLPGIDDAGAKAPAVSVAMEDDTERTLRDFTTAIRGPELARVGAGFHGALVAQQQLRKERDQRELIKTVAAVTSAIEQQTAELKQAQPAAELATGSIPI